MCLKAATLFATVIDPIQNVCNDCNIIDINRIRKFMLLMLMIFVFSLIQWKKQCLIALLENATKDLNMSANISKLTVVIVKHRKCKFKQYSYVWRWNALNVDMVSLYMYLSAKFGDNRPYTYKNVNFAFWKLHCYLCDKNIHLSINILMFWYDVFLIMLLRLDNMMICWKMSWFQNITVSYITLMPYTRESTVSVQIHWN